jgi:hypothetical protein
MERRSRLDLLVACTGQVSRSNMECPDTCKRQLRFHSGHSLTAQGTNCNSNFAWRDTSSILRNLFVGIKRSIGERQRDSDNKVLTSEIRNIIVVREFLPTQPTFYATNAR